MIQQDAGVDGDVLEPRGVGEERVDEDHAAEPLAGLMREHPHVDTPERMADEDERPALAGGVQSPPEVRDRLADRVHGGLRIASSEAGPVVRAHTGPLSDLGQDEAPAAGVGAEAVLEDHGRTA